MSTAVPNGEIIILSDDDDEEVKEEGGECQHDVSCSESSVLIVEVDDVKKSGKDCLRSTPARM